MMRATITAPDADGLCIGAYKLGQYFAVLVPRDRVTLARAYFLTTGDAATVRDLAIYGTPELPKARVGEPYATPDWMLQAAEKEGAK